MQPVECCIPTHLLSQKKTLMVFFWKSFLPNQFVERFFGSLKSGGSLRRFPACQKSLFAALKRWNATRRMLHSDAFVKPKENPDGFLLEIFPSESICREILWQSKKRRIAPPLSSYAFFMLFSILLQHPLPPSWHGSDPASDSCSNTTAAAYCTWPSRPDSPDPQTIRC